MYSQHLNMSAAEFEQIWSEIGFEQEVSLLVTGYSMRPFLKHSRSFVYIEKRKEYSVRRGDILLYVRDNGTVVLHRVIGKMNDGSYIMCGDAQTKPEHIRSDQIRAIVTRICRTKHIIRANSEINRMLASMWIFLRPLRPYIFKIQAIIRKIV